MTHPSEFLVYVAALLERLGIPYHVGGSVASSAHGMYRASADVDFVIDPTTEQLEALARELESEFYLSRPAMAEALSHRSTFNVVHDLIRDAAYATLPRQQKRKRHAQVAAFLEETTPEIPAAASALAQHWREAGEDRRAADYFVIAGDQAGRGWAKEEAVGFYQQALDLIGDEDPELRRKVTQRQAVAVLMVAHVADAELLGRRSPQPADPPRP